MKLIWENARNSGRTDQHKSLKYSMFCTDELRLCQESRVAQIPKVFNMHMGCYFLLLCLCQKLSFPKNEGNCSKQQLVLCYYQSLTHINLVDTQRSFFWLFETWKFAKTCLVIGGVNNWVYYQIRTSCSLTEITNDCFVTTTTWQFS